MAILAITFMLAGCSAPMAEPPSDETDSTHVGTNGAPSATTPEHGNIDPTRDSLNHTSPQSPNMGPADNGPSR